MNWSCTVMHFKIKFVFTQEADTSDDAQLLEDERRRQQLQAQEEELEVDMALIQEREERIHQLEVGFAAEVCVVLTTY